MMVYTAIVRAVNRRVLSDATSAFLAESEGSGHGHHLGTVLPRAMHHPIFSESKVLAGLA